MTSPATFVIACALGALGAGAAPLHAQAPAESAPAPMKKIAENVAVPRRGFNVVLLLGDMQGADAQDTVPIAARKALADMRDFLPYKSYRLLDTQWILGSTQALTRLRGVDDQEYELELRTSPILTPGTAAPSPTGISIRFVLREPGDPTTVTADSARTPFHPKEAGKSDTLEISREIFQLERERDDLQLTISKGRKQVEAGTYDPDQVKRQETQLIAVNRRIADLRQSASAVAMKAAGRTVIDTSFRMDDAETVVVGTSKVKGGGKALIALLTATSDRPKSR